MRKQLAQTRPADTTAANAFSADSPWHIDLIIVTNTTGTDRTFSLYHDADGSTYDEDSALLFDAPIRANDTAYIEFPTGIANVNRLGTLGVKSGAGDALNFTVYGYIAGERI